MQDNKGARGREREREDCSFAGPLNGQLIFDVSTGLAAGAACQGRPEGRRAFHRGAALREGGVLIAR